ncbi:Bgt-50561, partial [Blumeria graminis f. sp. tritici]
TCLYGFNLEKFISDDLPELCEENEPRSTKTLQKSTKISDNNVRADLLQVVLEEVYNILESLPTARLMWISLKTYYQPKSEAVVDILFVSESSSISSAPSLVHLSVAEPLS